MSKAVIVSIEKKQATVLRNDGGFIDVHTSKGWKCGDVIEVVKKTYRFQTFATAASIVLVLIGLYSWSFLTPFATVDMKINPQVEITVNRYSKIIKTEGLNQDGINLLKNTSLWGKSLESGYERLVTEIHKKGYFEEGKQLSISISADSQVNANEIQEDLALYTNEQFLAMDIHCAVTMHKYANNPENAAQFIKCVGSYENKVYICLMKPISDQDAVNFKIIAQNGTSIAIQDISIHENEVVLQVEDLLENEKYTFSIDQLNSEFSAGQYMECCISHEGGHGGE